MAKTDLRQACWQVGREVGRLWFVSWGKVRYSKSVKLKGILIALVVLGLIVGSVGAWWAWGRWTNSEERGVSLTMGNTPPPEQRPLLEKQFNETLDQESFLLPIVQEMGLVSFYGVQGEDEAVLQLRERSRLRFKDASTIWIVHRAERRRRGMSDQIGRMLGEKFINSQFPDSTQ